MARPPLPVGTWGKIRRETMAPGQYRARARFRDYDGVTRDVEAWGTTGPAAERELVTALRDRSAPSADEITRDTLISRLAEMWLEEIEAEGRLAPQSIDLYRDSTNGVILPSFGGLRIRENTVSRIDRCFKAVAAHHPAKARLARIVYGQMLGMAVRHGALDTNPVREIARLRTNPREVRALAVDDLDTVRAAIRQWQTPSENKPGPRRKGDLADIVDVLLATGGRIGEVLAVRGIDLDFDADPPTLTFSGTIVYVKGKGFYRQPWTKSDAGYRTLSLPPFAVEALMRRRASAQKNDLDAIFPSRKGTWLSPHNVRRQWREARKDTDLEWVTPHTFRKTVATLLDREADTKTAAAQLGHENEDTTKGHYIQKAHLAPDSSVVLNALGPKTGPCENEARE
jgi:integrase